MLHFGHWFSILKHIFLLCFLGLCSFSGILSSGFEYTAYPAGTLVCDLAYIFAVFSVVTSPLLWYALFMIWSCTCHRSMFALNIAVYIHVILCAFSLRDPVLVAHTSLYNPFIGSHLVCIVALSCIAWILMLFSARYIFPAHFFPCGWVSIFYQCGGVLGFCFIFFAEIPN